MQVSAFIAGTRRARHLIRCKSAPALPGLGPWLGAATAVTFSTGVAGADQDGYRLAHGMRDVAHCRMLCAVEFNRAVRVAKWLVPPNCLRSPLMIGIWPSCRRSQRERGKSVRCRVSMPTEISSKVPK